MIRASPAPAEIYRCHKALKTVTATSPDVAVLFAPYIRRRRRLSVYHIVAQKRTKVTMKRAISLGRVESFLGNLRCATFSRTLRALLLTFLRAYALYAGVYIYFHAKADKPCAPLPLS